MNDFDAGKTQPHAPQSKNVVYLVVPFCPGIPAFDAVAGSCRCSATSKQTGRRCRQIAVFGKNVCHWHGGRTPSGATCVHYCHGQRTKAAEQESKDLTQLARLMRLVEGLAPGEPVTPEMVELYGDLRARFYAGDLRRAEWQWVRRGSN
jgi:hypothetical protein